MEIIHGLNTTKYEKQYQIRFQSPTRPKKYCLKNQLRVLHISNRQFTSIQINFQNRQQQPQLS
jgi:hypothetical protein